MTFFSNTLFALREVLGGVLIGLVVIGATRLSAEEQLPSQDQALVRALENHPDIAAAKAKVALAESELRSKQMEVSRQIVGLYGHIRNLEAQTSAIKAKLSAAHEQLKYLTPQVQTGFKGVDEANVAQARSAVQAAEAELMQAMLQREQAEKELRLLIGNAQEAANPSTFSWIQSRQLPQGSTIDAIKRALDEKTSLEVADMPLKEALEFLSDKHHISIYCHPDVKDLAATTPLRLSVRNLPVRSVLQAIEDFNNGQLQFVVRDYGIVLGTHEWAKANGFVGAIEFGREPGGPVETITKRGGRGDHDAPVPSTRYVPPGENPFGPSTNRDRNTPAPSNRSTAPGDNPFAEPAPTAPKK